MIGSPFLNHPAPPLPLRSRGFQLAFRCFVAEILLSLAGLGLASASSDNPALVTLAQLAWILSAIANLGIWAGLFAPILYNWLRGRSNSQDQLLIIGQLADMLRLDVPLSEALEQLSKHQNDSWRSRFSRGCQALGFMAGYTAQGDRLGQAMVRVSYFPSHWAGLLDAAETRGALVEVLEKLEVGRSRAPWFTQWFWLRLLFIWITVLPMALFLVTYILPTFVALFEGMSLQLPPLTMALIFVVKLLRSPPGVLFQVALPLVGIGVALGTFFRPEFAKRLRNLAASVPPLSQVLPLEDQAAVAMTLSSCLHMGLSESEALEVAAMAAEHPTYHKALGGGGGVGLSPTQVGAAPAGSVWGISEALEKHPELFAPPLRWLAAQGQRHGNLEEALMAAAVYLSEVAEEKKIRWSVWLDTAVVFLFGALVAMVVIGSYLPIQQLVINMAAETVLP